MRRRALPLLLPALLAACGDHGSAPDGCADRACADVAAASDAADGSLPDADHDAALDARPEAATPDAAADASAPDADAAARTDASSSDGSDATVADARADASPDARADAAMDAPADAARPDASAPDAATSPCVSGATGNRAVRFRWDGSGPGSTAYVRYEANDLPDTSRWHVAAYSMSIGYTPVFDDTFLGAGGLDLEGTAFIDVELSTAGLGAIRGVTLAVFGRSFDTTASGSFSWQTFGGVGAAPTDLVSNVAPYRWYGADATTEFSPGDSGVLLRIYPGPSSGALIVNRVELCFDAP